MPTGRASDLKRGGRGVGRTASTNERVNGRGFAQLLTSPAPFHTFKAGLDPDNMRLAETSHLKPTSP